MPAEPAETTPRYLSLVETTALILSLFFVGVSFGGSSPLVSAILEGRGFSEYFTGAVVAMLSLGLAVFSPLAGRLVERFGPRRVNVSGLLLQGVGFAALGGALLTDERLLFPARLWLGLAAAATFVAAEFALIRGTPAAYRGRVMAAYGAGFGLGFMMGVFLSNRVFELIGVACFPMFTAVAILIAPIASWGMRGIEHPAARREAFGVDRQRRLPWKCLLIALYGAVVYAVLDIAMTGTYPVEGQRLGLSRTQALDIVGWMALGTVLIQPAAGWLADRFGHRLLLLLLAASGFGASIAAGYFSAVALPDFRLAATASFTIVGCAAGGIFPVSLALLGDRTPEALLSKANAAFSSVFGYASLSAPIVAAAFVDVAERWDLLGWAIPTLAALSFALVGPLAALDRRRD